MYHEEAVQTVTVERSGYKHTIRLYPDTFADDPRSWDNLCKFALNMRRYDLANDFEWLDFGDYNGFSEVLEAVLERENIVAYRAVWGYSHGGLVLSLSRAGQFSCRWDSGQVGYIFVTEESMLENFPSLSKEEWERQADEWIDAEFETYNAYVKGDVYFYSVTGDLVEDSCSGFYSAEDAIEHAENEINACINADLVKADNGSLVHELLG